MRIPIISFIFALTLTVISSYKNISNSLFVDTSSSKTVELIFEKKADKISDEKYLFYSIQIFTHKSESTLHTFKQSFYTYTSLNPLFRPPISA